MTAVDPQAPAFAQVPVTAEGVDGAERSDVRPDSAPASFGDVVRAYVGLTKPRIVELLLLTTVKPRVYSNGRELCPELPPRPCRY